MDGLTLVLWLCAVAAVLLVVAAVLRLVKTVRLGVALVDQAQQALSRQFEFTNVVHTHVHFLPTLLTNVKYCIILSVCLLSPQSG